MPKTYQDTVRIARALGVKYVWIDALCIIQDDVVDWEKESQVMAEIFRNSLVTIENSVWHTRGWTFQEDLFAMRKLYIGQQMMYWDSLKPVDIMRTEDKIIDDKLDRMSNAESSIIHSSEPWRGDYDYDGWYFPMLQYSQKRLTFETDRLPAVSSYAKLIASKSGDTYLAGLWKKNLHRGLLWKMHRRSRWTFGELLRSLRRP
ncbi:uncharacterized protein TRIVIDRAFT_138711, partial [Trichoderma virens Gv29-8]